MSPEAPTYYAHRGYVYNQWGYVMSADAWDSTVLAERHGTYAELPTRTD